MSKKTFSCATDAAVAYIERRPRTCAEVRAKLTEYGFSDKEISEAISELKAALLLNDEEYAYDFVQSRLAARPASKRALRSKLKNHKLEDSVIETALSQISDASEYENAYSEAAAFFRINLRKKEDKQKLFLRLYRRLVSRGFDFDTAKRAMNNAYDEMAEDYIDEY